MGNFLLRFWLHPSGTLSRRHYRMFLLIYFLGVLPILTGTLLAFLVIGWRGKEGILHEDTEVKFWIISTIFTVMAVWPLAVASIKRIHDLRLNEPFRFLKFNPIKGFQTFKRMLFERGPSADED